MRCPGAWSPALQSKGVLGGPEVSTGRVGKGETDIGLGLGQHKRK